MHPIREKVKQDILNKLPIGEYSEEDIEKLIDEEVDRRLNKLIETIRFLHSPDKES